jgi:hypothetical protein
MNTTTYGEVHRHFACPRHGTSMSSAADNEVSDSPSGVSWGALIAGERTLIVTWLSPIGSPDSYWGGFVS